MAPAQGGRDPAAPAANAAPAPATASGRIHDRPAGSPGAGSLRALRTEDGPALLLPAPPGTGLVILRRGEAILVVADAPLPLDAAPLRADPVFGGTEVRLLPEATVLRIPLAPPAALRARREAAGWTLTAAHSATPGRSIVAMPDGPAALLHAPSPGRIVPITDPETGLPLLLGTLTEPGAATPASLRAPQAEILPTMLGVAVLARGDTLALRPGADRFTLLGVSLPAASGAETLLTRTFDFPRLDPAAATQRLRSLNASIGEAPPLGRLGLRRDAAETLLALGLAQEAQAMIRLAFSEDPRAASDPRAAALHAAAAFLGGRTAEAGPLLDGGATDEAALWSGLARAARDEGGATAIAATMPLLLSYPEPLRARLLPLAAEALVAGGERAAASRLLDSRRDDASLDLARHSSRPRRAVAGKHSASTTTSLRAATGCSAPAPSARRSTCASRAARSIRRPPPPRSKRRSTPGGAMRARPTSACASPSCAARPAIRAPPSASSRRPRPSSPTGWRRSARASRTPSSRCSPGRRRWLPSPSSRRMPTFCRAARAGRRPS
ncbi:hypothetical protein ACE7GA_22670 [Roseomonas sp. CCTCC AB2023176]|uniref:hypothetical protein n=1 Tax=Roseomonas sp. CCTCC AB2023176 TaxID=3342640 RepID=UPI0035DF05C0